MFFFLLDRSSIMRNLKTVVMVMCTLAVACLWVGCGKEDGGSSNVDQSSGPEMAWIQAAETELKTVTADVDLLWGIVARYRVLLGDKSGGLKALDNVKGEWGPLSTYGGVAKALTQEGDAAAAKSLLAKLGDNASHHQDNIVRVLVAQGKLADARKIIEGVPERQKKKLWSVVAAVSASEGKLKEAEDALKEITEARDLDRARERMVVVLAGKGDFANAEKTANGIADDSSKKSALSMLADIRLAHELKAIVLYPDTYVMYQVPHALYHDLMWIHRDASLKNAVWGGTLKALKAGDDAAARQTAIDGVVGALEAATKAKADADKIAQGYLHIAATYQHFGDKANAAKMIARALDASKSPMLSVATAVALLARSGDMKTAVEYANKYDTTDFGIVAGSASYAQVMFADGGVDEKWIKNLTKPTARAAAYLGVVAATMDKQAKK
jgi:tetratricopeptide (TPR) repeat protein